MSRTFLPPLYVCYTRIVDFTQVLLDPREFFWDLCGPSSQGLSPLSQTKQVDTNAFTETFGDIAACSALPGITGW